MIPKPNSLLFVNMQPTTELAPNHLGFFNCSVCDKLGEKPEFKDLMFIFLLEWLNKIKTINPSNHQTAVRLYRGKSPFLPIKVCI